MFRKLLVLIGILITLSCSPWSNPARSPSPSFIEPSEGSVFSVGDDVRIRWSNEANFALAIQATRTSGGSRRRVLVGCDQLGGHGTVWHPSGSGVWTLILMKQSFVCRRASTTGRYDTMNIFVKER